MFKDGDLVMEFDSLKEAVSYTRIGKQYISKNMKENMKENSNKILKGFVFRFKKNPFD